MIVTGLLADRCPVGEDCPRIHDTDGDDVLVQGDLITEAPAGVRLGEAEGLVRVPRDLIYGRTLLDASERSAWLRKHHERDLLRIEVRDRYDVGSDGGDYRRYVHGEPEPVEGAGWLDMLRRDTAARKIRRKVHLVRDGQLSDYQRYAMEWGFARTTAAGEQVRIVDVDPDTWATTAAVGDYYLADGRDVLRMHYDGADRFTGAEVVYGAEAAVLRALAVHLWDRAEDFTTWWGQHPQCHRGRRAA